MTLERKDKDTRDRIQRTDNLCFQAENHRPARSDDRAETSASLLDPDRIRIMAMWLRLRVYGCTAMRLFLRRLRYMVRTVRRYAAIISPRSSLHA